MTTQEIVTRFGVPMAMLFALTSAVIRYLLVELKETRRLLEAERVENKSLRQQAKEREREVGTEFLKITTKVTEATAILGQAIARKSPQ